MDLESPFLKVALVKTKTGTVEKREIKKARLVGGNLELEKVEGGVAVFPAQDVLAILPLLPKRDDSCSVEEAEQAIRLLQGITPDLLLQAGLESTQIQEWEKLKVRVLELKKQKDEKDRKEKDAKQAEAKSNLEKEVHDWLKEAGEFRKPRTEKELMELRQSGETLAGKSPEQMESILEAMAVLSQVQPKEKGETLPDLSKLNEIQPKLIPDELLGWLSGGVVLFSIFGLFFGLAFLSSSLTRFKEGAFLGGITFGILGLGLLGVLIWTWLPIRVTGQALANRVDPKMDELEIYLKNRTKTVYYFPKKQFSFSPDEWMSWILGYLPASEESIGLFRVRMKEGGLWLTENSWTWQQPLTGLAIPLPFRITFEGKNPNPNNWANPDIAKVYLGRWSIPDAIAGLLKDSASSIWRQGLSSAGLAGVKLEKGEKGMILITVPAAGVRPKYELPKKEETPTQVASPYRKQISAEEMAQEFQKGHGKEFIGKFVLLEGFVERVESGSEVSGVPVASKQVGERKNKDKDESSLIPNGEFGQSTYDSFYLRTGSKPIRCLIKSQFVFVQDERKDIYLGPSADTISVEPFIKNGYRVKLLTEGRVEEVNRYGEIEVYGIRLDPGKLKEQIEIFDPIEVQKK